LLCRGHRRLAPEHLALPQQLAVSKRTAHNLDTAVTTPWTTLEEVAPRLVDELVPE